MLTLTPGCPQCSRRRIDCDGAKPSCKKCASRGLTCSGFGTNYRFRDGLNPRFKGQRLSDGPYDKSSPSRHEGNTATSPYDTTLALPSHHQEHSVSSQSASPSSSDSFTHDTGPSDTILNFGELEFPSNANWEDILSQQNQTGFYVSQEQQMLDTQSLNMASMFDQDFSNLWNQFPDLV